MFPKIQRSWFKVIQLMPRENCKNNSLSNDDWFWVGPSKRLFQGMRSNKVKYKKGSINHDLKWPFVQNIKTLSSKYYYDKNLFKLFCDLVDRDMDYPCLCKNSTKNICSKKCRALDFCALADVLDAIAQINYIYINKVSYVLNMYDFWSIFMVFDWMSHIRRLLCFIESE